MRENDFRNALEQVELSAEAQQRIIDACAAGTASEAPRRKRVFAPIAIAAAVVLLLAAGTLLPGLLSPDYSFTITAYALDENGETVRTELSTQPVNFNLNSQEYAIYTGVSGYGETLTSIKLICEGSNIRTITYSAEDCVFLDEEGQKAWEKRMDEHLSSNEEIRKNSASVEEPLDEQKASYTVDYLAQEDEDYMLLYPLHQVDEDYDGEYPIISPPAITREAIKIDERIKESYARSPLNYFIAKEAYITATITFKDGSTQSTRLLLMPQETGFWYTISIKIIEQ